MIRGMNVGVNVAIIGKDKFIYKLVLFHFRFYALIFGYWFRVIP